MGWGSSRGAIEESVTTLYEQGYKVAGLHFKIVYPLPLGLADIFKRYKQVVTVETAYGDAQKATPFAMMLRSETLCDVQCLISDATGRPLKPDYMVQKVKHVLQEAAHV